MNSLLAARAWGELLFVDLAGLAGFKAIHRLVIRTRLRGSSGEPPNPTAVIEAMKTACAFYLKHAQCLQRSAALTRLLRREGVPAEMVIGCHLVPPLKAHAWVEIAGEVVHGYEQGIEYYAVVDRW